MHLLRLHWAQSLHARKRSLGRFFIARAYINYIAVGVSESIISNSFILEVKDN